MCGATSYRRVIARDDHGALRPTDLYECSGCSVVFADSKAWRDGGADDLAAPPPSFTPLRPSMVTAAEARAAVPSAPSPASCGVMPRGVGFFERAGLPVRQPTDSGETRPHRVWQHKRKLFASNAANDVAAAHR